MDQIPAQGHQFTRVEAASFGAKYKSKREIFTFLTVDAKVYLPNYELVTIYFMRDIIMGVKKCKF